MVAEMNMYFNLQEGARVYAILFRFFHRKEVRDHDGAESLNKALIKFDKSQESLLR